MSTFDKRNRDFCKAFTDIQFAYVEAEAENAKLLESNKKWMGKAARFEVENAKLRELVRDMWPHVRYRSRMCGECELPCDTSDECLLYEPMRQRMRELVIEVD